MRGRGRQASMKTSELRTQSITRAYVVRIAEFRR